METSEHCSTPSNMHRGIVNVCIDMCVDVCVDMCSRCLADSRGWVASRGWLICDDSRLERYDMMSSEQGRGSMDGWMGG